jgi:hypothetical protein
MVCCFVYVAAVGRLRFRVVASGAPEVAWGDSFFFYDPDGDAPTDRRMPFATIVTNDYDGNDKT